VQGERRQEKGEGRRENGLWAWSWGHENGVIWIIVFIFVEKIIRDLIISSSFVRLGYLLSKWTILKNIKFFCLTTNLRISGTCLKY
jgi:hypothetical protein